MLRLGLLLITAISLAATAHAQTPTAVSTFHAIGLYWQPAGGAVTNTCTVQYRPVGTTNWFTGLPLWFDANPKPTSFSSTEPITKDPARINEYRGSIVDLAPGTNYEIKLTLASGTTQTITCATLAEDFWNVSPVSVTPITSRTTPLVITAGGNSATGRFAIYDGANGGGPGINAVIDLSADTTNAAVSVLASYVVLRNCTVIGGRHGVRLGDGTTGSATTVSPTNDIHHIVIENCDISGWGAWKTLSGGTQSVWGVDTNAGIFAESRLLEHVIIQRNRIHDPRTRANSWRANAQTTVLPSSSSGHHPQGPEAIKFKGKDQPNGFEGTAGHHIIRYNEIWSTDGVGDGDAPTAGHGFNDGMGGEANKSFAGFPGRDSDIYCNYIANCWDDAIEAEGGNMNVRIWANYAEFTFQAFAHAGCSLGPLYSFRNVAGFARENPQRVSDPRRDIHVEDGILFGANYPDSGSFYKLGWSTTNPPDGWSNGRTYILHNTSLQPVFISRPSGVVNGLSFPGGKLVENLFSRNNILHIKDTSGFALSVPLNARELPGNDLDYDMSNDSFTVGADDELNKLTGALGTPSYTAVPFAFSPGPRAPELASGSPGRDSAQVLANFGDFFNNGGPDRGAVENGKGLIPVGVSADWSDYLIGPTTQTIPRITTLDLPAGIVGTPYSVTLNAVGGDGTTVWRVREGTLPLGFALSASGVLSGPALTAAAMTTFVAAAGDSDSIVGPTDEGTQKFLLTIHPLDDTLGPVVAPMLVRSGTTSQPKYTFTVPYGASGSGSTTRVIAVTLLDSAGTPQGSTLVTGSRPSAADRISFQYTMPLNLTPGTSYQWRIELKASSTGAVLDTEVITGVEVQRQALRINQTSVPGATVGTAYSTTLTARDAVGSVTWSISGGALPPGITLNNASGVISGTPTGGGTYTFTARVTDSINQTDTETMDLVVSGGSNSVPVITTTSLPNALAGVAYSQTLAATGGDGALTWSLDSGALPDGIALSAAGELNGTPTAPGVYSFTVRVADSDGATGAADEDTQALTLTVDGRTIGVNLGDSANALTAAETAGAVPQANWNNSTAASETLSNVIDNTGAATTADITFGDTPYNYNNNTTGTSGDAKLMRSQRGRSNANAMRATAAQVPYATYDVYVYWGGRTPLESVPLTMTVNFQLWDGTAWVTSETKYIKDTNRVWDGTYNESLATTAAAAVDGEEYVVFRNVTATTFRISVTSGVRTGICGLQIVER